MRHAPEDAVARLPVADVLPELLSAMERRHAVLVAEPGAGKTTLVPPALLDAPWLGGRIVLLEPRRVVARAAADRIAAMLGGKVGGIVGTRMRMDVRVSDATRIEVVTEGVFARTAVDDPELHGIGTVVFDEFHERSLDADFGLALALDIARSLRPDLRLLVMSATIEAERVAALMDGAAIVRSKGRAHPVTIRYRPVGPRDPVERVVAAAAVEGDGSTLAFVPGRAEVERVVAAIGDRLGTTVLPLHGGLDAAAQDRAVRPLADGGRKIVVATPIAESSLTIDGIERVVDSGLVREPVHDVATGITRLETRRASLASVEQRAGRAGRTAPGEAIRLWSEGATRALPAHAPPEIVRADLTQLLLDCLDWGIEPRALSWLDPPPTPALAAAGDLLVLLGAAKHGADGTLRITGLGRSLRTLPLPPRDALAVSLAAPGTERVRTARLAMLASERGLGGDAIDLLARERRWRSERTVRAKSASALASRWAGAARAAGEGMDAETAFARAYADRIARARGPARPDGRRPYLLASGRGAFVPADDPLAKQEWLVALDLTGRAREQRIVSALALTRDMALEGGAALVAERGGAALAGERIEAHRTHHLGAIVIERTRVPVQALDPAVLSGALVDAIASRGVPSLAWDGEARRLRSRLLWLAARRPGEWPDVTADALETTLGDWLLPHVPGATGLDAITPSVLRDAILALVPWDRRAELDRLAPERFVAPTGTRVAIDYPDDGGSPRIAVRVQELFGLDAHPTAAGEALLLDLLSPARRPIQTTGDLPGFWRGSWADVRRDMRARYPRHPWPERPWEAEPTVRAKPRG